MKLAIVGAAGRMGRAVVQLAHSADDVRIVGAAESPTSGALGRDVGEVAGVGPLGVLVSSDLPSALLGADVVVDFSRAETTATVARLASRTRVAMVSGTTGLGAEEQAELDHAAERVPLLWAPNLSLGVAVVCSLVTRAARALGPEFDVEIVETHHGAKADAPSGTALALVAAAREARPELEVVYGRHGVTGARPRAAIGVHALRGGGIVGDHSVHLLGARERIEITHRSLDRSLFADGALHAARFVFGRAPGRYRVADLMG